MLHWTSHNRSIERGTKRAKFRYKATLEQLDYTTERGIDKNQIHRFGDAVLSICQKPIGAWYQ